MNTDCKICKQPYSYHTFIFPFLFDCGADNNRRKFLEYLPTLGEYMYEDAFNPKCVDKASHDTHRYFNQAMRNAMYTTNFDESAIVWNYRYDIERMAKGKDSEGKWRENRKTEDNPAVLVIKKDDFRSEMAINGVRLKLFNTGVGMLIFELENYQHYSEECITKINEFGRRVFMPFVKDSSNHICSLCADEISLRYDGKEIEAASGKVSGVKCTSVDEISFAPIIKYFLSNNTKGITTTPNSAKNEFYIEPIIDDRMFVACIYGNADFANRLKQWDDISKTYKYISDADSMFPGTDNNLARRLYEMVFVDGDGMCCYNRVMLKKLLEKHIYARWLEYGTVTGITEYSMVSVTSGLSFLSLPFLTEYVEMVVLVLAQRASLLAFERIISEIACGNAKLDMNKVQKKYIKFQSELLLQEVTAQQQGIEMYNMMLDNMFINQQQSGVENQIRSLFEINSAANEKNENWILFILALLGISEVVQILTEWGANALAELGVTCSALEYLSKFGDTSRIAIAFIAIAMCFVWKRISGKKWLK